jgi:hypothetical protein
MKKYLYLALLLTGCATYQKQQRRAETFYKRYPNQLARLCADAFPVKKELVMGHDTLLQTDTLSMAVRCPPSAHDTTIFTRYLQHTRLRVDTLYKIRTAVEDTLRLHLLVQDNQLSQVQQKQKEVLAKNRKLTGLAVALCALIVFLVVVVVKTI